MRLAQHAIRQRQAGFTLAEMLVTVGIVAVVSAVGLPMLRGFIDDAAVTGNADQALAALNYTRSEAVKRNTRVTMCRSTDGANCTAAVTGSAEWRGGWIVFVDGTDAGEVDSGDQILRVQGALTGAGKLLATGNVNNYVSYLPNGQPRTAEGASQDGNFYACADATTAKRRRIALTPGTGWVGVEIVAAAATCNS